MTHFIRTWGSGWLLPLVALLSGCSAPDSSLPTVTHNLPSPNSPVSGTVVVLINAVDDLGIKGVDLYVRGKGSSGRGMFFNSAVDTSPFVVNWNASSNMPNQTDLELIAVAKDAAGNESESPVIAVKTQTTSVAGLQL